MVRKDIKNAEETEDQISHYVELVVWLCRFACLKKRKKEIAISGQESGSGLWCMREYFVTQ